MWPWLLACTPTPPDPTVGWDAGVSEAPAPAPARLAGPLLPYPGPDDRPVETARFGLCHDRPGAREALLAGLAATPADERGEWMALTPDVGCDDPSWCPWVRERLEAAGPSEASVWLGALWPCTDPESTALVLEQAPEPFLRAYVEGSLTTRAHGPLLPWSERLGPLTAQAAVADEFSDAWFRALGRIPDPRAHEALRAAWSAASGTRQAQIGRTFDGALDPADAAIAEQACAMLGGGCVGPRVLDDLALAVRLGFDPVALVVRAPHLAGALREPLARCVADPELAVAHPCAVALATLDPAAAAAAIAAAPEASALGDVLVVPPDEARAALRACGFRAEGEGPPPHPTWSELLGPGEALVLTAVSSDDTGPGLSYRLAHLAGLDDVAFDVLEGPDFQGPRAFLAWADGRRWRVVSRDAVAVDVPSSVRLVNGVLAARGRAERVLPDETSTRYVVGTPGALACAAAAGHLRFAPAPVSAPEGPTEGESR